MIFNFRPGAYGETVCEFQISPGAYEGQVVSTLCPHKTQDVMLYVMPLVCFVEAANKVLKPQRKACAFKGPRLAIVYSMCVRRSPASCLIVLCLLDVWMCVPTHRVVAFACSAMSGWVFLLFVIVTCMDLT